MDSQGNSDTGSVASGVVWVHHFQDFDGDMVEEEAEHEEQTQAEPQQEEVKKDEASDRKMRLLHTFNVTEDVPSDGRLSAMDHMHKILFSSSESEDKVVIADRHSVESSTDTDELLRREFSDGDDDSDSNDIVEPVKSDTVKTKAVFLSNFIFPELSDVQIVGDLTRSTRGTHVRYVSVKKHMKRHSSFEGFVNPIDKENQAEEEESITIEEEIISESSDFTGSRGVTINNWPDLGSDDDDLLELNDDSSLFKVKPLISIQQSHHDALVKFQESFIRDWDVKDDEDEEEDDAIKIREQRDLARITTDFLYDLFDAAVDKVEDRNEWDRLRNRLDRGKLWQKIRDARAQLECEIGICEFTNYKMFEYFKRVRANRNLVALPPGKSSKEHARYREALTVLDYWLKVAAETKKLNAYFISRVYMDLAYARNITLQTEEHLETVIINTLARNKSENMQRFVERELRLMNQKRNEISDTRLFLITRKHTLGRYIAKTKKLEKINDDLCMDDFITINNQVLSLDKKIEERNSELKRMRIKYHSDLHEMQHNREKTMSLAHRLAECRNTLFEKKLLEDELRQKLYDAKRTHSRNRKQHTELSYQGGLLAMPALMLDYDATVVRVKEKTAKVKELKETYRQMSHRIDELESRCL